MLTECLYRYSTFLVFYLKSMKTTLCITTWKFEVSSATLFKYPAPQFLMTLYTRFKSTDAYGFSSLNLLLAYFSFTSFAYIFKMIGGRPAAKHTVLQGMRRPTSKCNQFGLLMGRDGRLWFVLLSDTYSRRILQALSKSPKHQMELQKMYAPTALDLCFHLFWIYHYCLGHDSHWPQCQPSQHIYEKEYKQIEVGIRITSTWMVWKIT